MNSNSSWFTKSEKVDSVLTEAFLNAHLLNAQQDKYNITLFHTPEYYGYDAVVAWHFKGTGNLHRIDRFEVKKRERKYDSMMIQRNKFNSLMEAQVGIYDRSYYLNFLPDGETVLFNLTKMVADGFDFDFQPTRLPENSAGAAGWRSIHNCKIPIELGTQFDFDWTQVDQGAPIKSFQLDKTTIDVVKAMLTKQ